MEEFITGNVPEVTKCHFEKSVRFLFFKLYNAVEHRLFRPADTKAVPDNWTILKSGYGNVYEVTFLHALSRLRIGNCSKF